MWLSYRFIRLYRGFPMVFYGFSYDFLWFSMGVLMVFYGFSMVSDCFLWFPMAFYGQWVSMIL